jgi:Bacterial regulatory proteins, gntR family
MPPSGVLGSSSVARGFGGGRSRSFLAYGPGDRLPGENDLMPRYGVARMTAGQALAVLLNEGIATAAKAPASSCASSAVGSRGRLADAPQAHVERHDRGVAERELADLFGAGDLVAHARSALGVLDVRQRLGLLGGHVASVTCWAVASSGTGPA